MDKYLFKLDIYDNPMTEGLRLPFVKLNTSFKHSNPLFLPLMKSDKPYFALLNENGIVRTFIEAVSKGDDERAMLLVSKKPFSSIDLIEIYNLFCTKKNYKYMHKIDSSSESLFTIVSFLVTENGKNGSLVFHVKMVKEPDTISKWKIYDFYKDN